MTESKPISAGGHPARAAFMQGFQAQEELIDTIFKIRIPGSSEVLPHRDETALSHALARRTALFEEHRHPTA
ncbi:MAG: hypothetical protein ABI343_11140 [Burkholderiaceae bacterium]